MGKKKSVEKCRKRLKIFKNIRKMMRKSVKKCKKMRKIAKKW